MAMKKSLLLFSAMAVLALRIPRGHAENVSGNLNKTMDGRVNRSVLTVGREVFSSADAAAILALWNLTRASGEKPVAIETKWLAGFSLLDLVSPDVETMNKIWPEDIRTFFQLALIWVDVQKLNLFIPRDQEVNSLLKNFKDKQEALLTGIEPVLAREIAHVSDKTKRKWVETVIRARTFYRVRGSFERNKNLFSVGWYWHNDLSKEQLKK